MKPLLKEDELYSLKEHRQSVYKLLESLIPVLNYNLLSFRVETEDKLFNLMQLKSQIDGANKLLVLVKDQLEPTKGSKP